MSSMKWDQQSRRQFLVGLAKTAVMLPVLPSLLTPEQAKAANNPVRRFVGLANCNGRWHGDWFPSLAASAMTSVGAETPGGYREVLLKDLSGPISHVFQNSYSFNNGALTSAGFTGAIRENMNIIRGLDGLWPNPEGHQMSIVFGGNLGIRPDYEKRPGSSIDQVLAYSHKVYPTAPRRRVLNLGVSSGMSLLYNSTTQTSAVVSSIQNPADVFQLLFPSSGTVGVNRSKVVDRVKEAYDSLKASSRISKSDRLQLEEHFTSLSEMESSLSAFSCIGAPTSQVSIGFKSMSTRAEYLKAQIKLITLAIKCGMTNIATLQMSRMTDDDWYSNLGTMPNQFHSMSHTTMGYPEIREISRFFASQLVHFYDELSVEEGSSGKSYLDSTLVMWGNSMGDGKSHSYKDLPVILLGGKEMLRTGLFIDYSRQGESTALLNGTRYDKNDHRIYAGRNYLQLLALVLRAMGLSDADYNYPGVATGFGTDSIGYSGDPHLLWAQKNNVDITWRTNRGILPGLLKT